MCGILCCVTSTATATTVKNQIILFDGNELDEKFKLMIELLKSRGPDITYSLTKIIKSEDGSKGAIIHLTGNVLWTQGPAPLRQPYQNPEHDNSNYLLFNGDIYKNKLTKYPEFCHLSHTDGQYLFNRLEKAENTEEILQTFASIEGPYAFIYFNPSTCELWFGRDFFGRESLLLSYDKYYSTSFFLSSVSNLEEVYEVPTIGIFSYSISERKLQVFPWDSHRREQLVENFQSFITALDQKGISTTIKNSFTLPCVRTLFKPLPNDPENDSVLQQLLGINSSIPIEILAKASQILDSNIQEFLIHLRTSVQKRVKVQPSFCKTCVLENIPCQHSKISVLFSGGIDSMVLAYLVAELLSPGESMDLLNVAFYPNEVAVTTNQVQIPDRVTGLAAVEVLKTKFPSIKINFIPVNVTKSELEKVRKERIRHLIHPLNSVLDDSIGCCLWFAARGNHQSLSRIILLGSGADELLGGYSRHRSAFEDRGWKGLREEMQLDVDRISARNLGRDNRVLSDHGVAPRFPFLDESVVEFLTRDCDIWVKCCPLPKFHRGVGEKLLLRATLYKLLGEENAEFAVIPKRAMQFGTKIAKLENSKEKGGQVCKRLYDSLDLT